MSLTTCLKKLGKNVSAEDRAAIQDLAAGFRRDGMKPNEAASAAVRAHMEGLGKQMEAMRGQASGSIHAPQPPTLKPFSERLDQAMKDRGIAVEKGDHSHAGGEPGARKITLADMSEADFMAKHGNTAEDVKAHEFAHTFWAGATALPNFKDPRNAPLKAELKAVSQEFRPYVWKNYADHAKQTNELMADGMAFWLKNPGRRAEFPALDKMMREYDAGDLLKNFPDPKSDGGAKLETQSLDTQLAQKIATEQPDLQVVLPGTEERVTVAEALSRIAEEQKQDGHWVELVRVAAECALGN